MAQQFKRWYDFDPELLKLINILKDYQEELKEQASIFLETVETKVSKETLNVFYEQSKQINGGNRWYDKDPVISRTVELLRIVPPEMQKQAAQNFIKTLEDMGITMKEMEN